MREIDAFSFLLFFFHQLEGAKLLHNPFSKFSSALRACRLAFDWTLIREEEGARARARRERVSERPKTENITCNPLADGEKVAHRET